MKKLAILSLTLAMFASCVSKKKFIEMEGNRDALQSSYNDLQVEFDNCQSQVALLESDVEVTQSELLQERAQYTTLQAKLDTFQKTNTNLLIRLEDLSIVDAEGAASIQQSLALINQQNLYISDLKSSIQRKDSLNSMLLMKLKRSLSDVADDDVSVKVEKGVVYISLSDKMLYKSGSSRINPSADSVLAKIARVINDHQGFDILVEGHTDDVPIRSIPCVEDNWDLSTKRAIAVVRKLQEEHGVAPERMTAGGKAFYEPKTANDSDAGRSQNRRTEIIVLPRLDQFFELMEPVAMDGGKTQPNETKPDGMDVPPVKQEEDKED